MNYKQIAYTLFFALARSLTQAQVKIGSNPTTITSGALLDIEGATHTVSMANGNFGIGTTNPITALDINGGVSFSSNSVNGLIAGGSGILTMRTGSNSLHIDNNTGSANLLTVTNGGRVGIGVVAPISTLDVNGGIAFSGNSVNGLVAGGSGILSLRTGSNSLHIDNNAGSANLVTVTDGGAVGIGTPTPGAKLDIIGNVRIADGTQGRGKILTSDGNGVASWKPLGGQSGAGFSSSLIAGGPFNINYGANDIYPFGQITIAESGSYMVVIRTFGGVSVANQTVAFYSFINRNGTVEDIFEFYTQSGVNGLFGTNGTLFFTANAGDVINIGLRNGYNQQPTIQVSATYLARNNVQFIKVN